MRAFKIINEKLCVCGGGVNSLGSLEEHGAKFN